MTSFLDEKSKKPIGSVAIRFVFNGYNMVSSSVACGDFLVLELYSFVATLRAATSPVPLKLRYFLLKEKTLLL